MPKGVYDRVSLGGLHVYFAASVLHAKAQRIMVLTPGPIAHLEQIDLSRTSVQRGETSVDTQTQGSTCYRLALRVVVV